MKQLTKEQAIEFAESGIWKDWTSHQIVEFQLFQKKLCISFDRFHEAIEEVLKRPVFTHEFANRKSLQREFLGDCKAPSFEEIFKQFPKDKQIILVTE